MTFDATAARETYDRDGVVLARAVLDQRALEQALAAYDWSLAHPGPGSNRISQAGDAIFYQDLCNPGAPEAYGDMLRVSPISGLVASLWGTSDIWFMYEQVFLKEGGDARRTPWHQDSSYLAVGGRHLAVAWISFDPVAREDSLEFVRGSHQGPLFNGSRFELGDDTAPLYPDAALPRLPDIEADRDAYDIVSFAVEPGDVVLFHPAMLHGGAPTRPGQRRRTLTLRYFGPDARYETRPGRAGPRIKDFHEHMKPGDPFRHPAFVKLGA